MLVRNLEMKTLIRTLLFLAFFCGFIVTQNDVRKPPSITKGPQREVIFRENQEVTLTCKAEGTPSLTYVWKKNGDDLNFNQPTISRGSDGDIMINSITRSDDGFYQCFATNQYGTALSIVAHIQMAFLERTSQSNSVNITVPEGRPFVIPSARRKSFRTATYSWEITTSDVDPRPRLFQQSQRVQSACNGDLYVAYALKEDGLGGSLYKSTVFNANVDARSGGSYTRVMVTQGSGPTPDFPPNISYFSKSHDVALIGGNMELECFFSGKPLPNITWSRPRNNLPSGRSSISNYATKLTISNISKSDEGDYVCTATNTIGTINQTLNIRVEAVPIFRRESDGPRNVNVTEGDSVTFNCSTFAKPEATVVWLRNGQPIDANTTPMRFAFSDNSKSLTIRDVCRDCVDQERQTDLTVIQCNASNVHGYAFASGYLNVLLRTKVTLLSNSTFVSVDLTKENRFQFICSATSDPSTSLTVRWYRVRYQRQESVYSEPPYVYVMDGNLTIYTAPNCSTCDKYLAEYMCVGDNGYSQDTVTVTFNGNTVAPKFIRESDGPRNVNVTEGDSVTFNCSALAVPEATVVWLRNGQPIDVNYPPERFVFSNDLKSLTIRDVCQNCTDRKNQTDQMVIQCNASNVHGYVFAQGYLNVLMKTKVTIRGARNVSVDFLEEKQLIFHCHVISDPSTPATVRWYKTEPFGDLVRDEMPFIHVENEFLIILICPICSLDCAKYLGEYICIGDNGYSKDNQTITISYQYRPPPEGKNDEICTVWKIILGAIGLVLFLIGIFIGFCSKRCNALNRRSKDRKLLNPPSIYEHIGYDSVGIPLEGIGSNDRSMRRACSMYEHLGYDSIDQVLSEIGKRERPAPFPSDVHQFISYESIDTPQVEAINRGRPILDEDTKYDNAGYSFPLKEAINRNEIDQIQVHGGYESIRSESEKFPNSNEQSEALNAYSDLNRLEVNSYLDLGAPKINNYLDRRSKEVDPYMDMGQKEVNPYLDMGEKEMDPNLYMTPDPIRQPASPALREADYLVLKN